MSATEMADRIRHPARPSPIRHCGHTDRRGPGHAPPLPRHPGQRPCRNPASTGGERPGPAGCPPTAPTRIRRVSRHHAAGNNSPRPGSFPAEYGVSRLDRHFPVPVAKVNHRVGR